MKSGAGEGRQLLKHKSVTKVCSSANVSDINILVLVSNSTVISDAIKRKLDDKAKKSRRGGKTKSQRSLEDSKEAESQKD